MTDPNIGRPAEKPDLLNGRFWLLMVGMVAVITLGGIFFS